jgi:hypothetical protein
MASCGVPSATVVSRKIWRAKREFRSVVQHPRIGTYLWRRQGGRFGGGSGGIIRPAPMEAKCKVEVAAAWSCMWAVATYIQGGCSSINGSDVLGGFSSGVLGRRGSDRDALLRVHELLFFITRSSLQVAWPVARQFFADNYAS